MTEAARTMLVDDMRGLEQDILEMGSTVEQMLHKAVEALRTMNPSLARDAIAMDDIVDRYNLSVESQCLRLLALQQPMAGDLRMIATAMKIITDIERMGDYVVDIAKTALHLADKTQFRPPIEISRMADLVKRMLREALESFVTRDLALIETMVEHDDEVDRLDSELHAELITYMKKDTSVADQAMRLLMAARYLERLADHVTNVGERVYYMQTGEMKELHGAHRGTSIKPIAV